LQVPAFSAKQSANAIDQHGHAGLTGSTAQSKAWSCQQCLLLKHRAVSAIVKQKHVSRSQKPDVQMALLLLGRDISHAADDQQHMHFFLQT
jgi:Zn-finger protein